MQNTGYTLIEILIVVFIISIVTSVALLSIGQNENKRLAAFANTLAQTIQLAEEQAMLQPAVIGLSFKNQSLQFSMYQADSGNWLPSEDVILNTRPIPTDIHVAVEVGGQRLSTENELAQPQIIISTNGDVTPFTLYVGKKGQHSRYKVRGEADGTVSNAALN